MKTGKYDRYILLQGQDYPLFSSELIHYYFVKNYSIEYCKGFDVSVSKNKNEYMLVCGLWFHDYNKSIVPMRLFAGVIHQINRIGIKYRKSTITIERSQWHIYKGWAQWALTNACIEYIVNSYNMMKKYNRFFKYRFPPDEMYFQTLIYNNERFRKKLYDGIIVNRNGAKTFLNLTYFEYPDEVVVFHEASDYEWLKDTGCLFVRKVNSNSVNLINRVDSEIIKNKGLLE